MLNEASVIIQGDTNFVRAKTHYIARNRLTGVSARTGGDLDIVRYAAFYSLTDTFGRVWVNKGYWLVYQPQVDREGVVLVRTIGRSDWIQPSVSQTRDERCGGVVVARYMFEVDVHFEVASEKVSRRCSRPGNPERNG